MTGRTMESMGSVEVTGDSSGYAATFRSPWGLEDS